MTKRLYVALFIAIVLALVISLILPKNINHIYTAVQYRTNDMSDNEVTNITIKGKLYTKMVSPRFTGKIQIGAYQELFGYDMLDIALTRQSNGTYLGFLSYNTDRADWSSFGAVIIPEEMNEICIMVYEPMYASRSSYSDESGLVVVAPANNVQTAHEIKERLYTLLRTP